MLDLGAGADQGGSIALDTGASPEPPRRAGRASRPRGQSSSTLQERGAPAARPGGGSGMHPAQRRASSGTLPAARTGSTGGHPAVRTGSTGGHPAVRTGSTGGHPAVRGAGARDATIADGTPVRGQPVRARTTGGAATRTESATRAGMPEDGLAATAADPGAMPYGRGMMLGDDPFNEAFRTGADAPALELVTDDVDDEQEPIEAGPPPETPEQARARQIAELAGYGPPPANMIGAPLYWIRVLLRKRVLDTELLSLSAQRKRAEDTATQALAAMGQALHALDRDDRLEKLKRQLAAVDSAGQRIGDVEAQGAKRKQNVQGELARLDGELADLERKAAPLREREAVMLAELGKLEGAAKRAEMVRRKLDGELEALQRKGGADVETWSALKAERDARLGEVQTLGIQMRPLQDDLAVVRKDLTQQLRAISVVQDEKQAAATALERAQQSHRMSSGSARGALQQALVAVANAALKHGLSELVPEQAQVVCDTRERAQQKRAQEELQRAATESFDHVSYSRGMLIMLGGSGLFFLSLAFAILF